MLRRMLPNACLPAFLALAAVACLTIAALPAANAADADGEEIARWAPGEKAAYDEYRAAMRKGQYRQALPLARKWLEICEKEHGAKALRTGQVLSNLGILYTYLDEYDKAELNYERAIEIFRDLKAEGEIAKATANMGGLYLDMKQYDKAEDCFLDSLDLNEKLYGLEDPKLAGVFNNLGMLYYTKKNYDRSDRMLRRAVNLAEKSGKDELKLSSYLNNQGQLYTDMGQHATAEACLLRSIQLKEKTQPPQHPSYARPLRNLVFLYKKMGDKEKAAATQARLDKISGGGGAGAAGEKSDDKPAADKTPRDDAS